MTKPLAATLLAVTSTASAQTLVATDAPGTRGGPRTEATKPPRTDVTMFFELGVHWGG